MRRGDLVEPSGEEDREKLWRVVEGELGKLTRPVLGFGIV